MTVNTVLVELAAVLVLVALDVPELLAPDGLPRSRKNQTPAAASPPHTHAGSGPIRRVKREAFISAAQPDTARPRPGADARDHVGGSLPRGDSSHAGPIGEVALNESHVCPPSLEPRGSGHVGARVPAIQAPADQWLGAGHVDEPGLFRDRRGLNAILPPPGHSSLREPAGAEVLRLVHGTERLASEIAGRGQPARRRREALIGRRGTGRQRALLGLQMDAGGWRAENHAAHGVRLPDAPAPVTGPAGWEPSRRPRAPAIESRGPIFWPRK